METQQKYDGEIEIDLMQIIKLLISKVWIMIVVGAITGLLALLGTKLLITPMYQSTAKLYINSRQNDSNTTLSDVQVSTQIVKDYKVLVTSRPVIEQVISNLDIDMEPEQLIKAITCKIETDSRVLSITVTNKDPYLAKQVVDELANVSSSRIPKVTKIEGVEIIEYGIVPENQSSPNTMMNTVVGAMLGIVIVMAVVVIRFILDDTIKNSEDVEKHLGMSTLALIPMTEEEYNGQGSKKKRFGLFGRKRG